MSGQHTFVIVGAGLAGAKTAERLRVEGFEGRIIMFGDERERPYNRPPLSKDFLRGRMEREMIDVHPAGWYAENDIELRPNEPVSSISPSRHKIATAAGASLPYDKLLLATGASPRPLPVPGGDGDRVLYLRGIEDCLNLRSAFERSARVTIIGAGWLGLETAAAARAGGLEVTVVGRGEFPLQRLLGPEAGEMFARLHTGHGVDLRMGVEATRITDDGGRTSTVHVDDGTTIAADVIVAAVGARPNVSLAEEAGLVLDNGIKVDEHLRTSDADIFAAGDVANAFHPMLADHVRIEHWFNALRQPTVAARSMLGRDATSNDVPFFYSDQYELGLEYSGHVDPGDYDDVVFRGSKETFDCVVFWLKAGRVLAGMNVNVWDVTGPIKSLVRAGGRVDRAKLADPQIPLAQVLADMEAADSQ